ncbi:L-threonylcarbamoyladenylate synthase [Methanobrevibacter curvatus]|nr:L-threonylcarbamoyladenylate synthase [Methanobrevibacter curvatus]
MEIIKISDEKLTDEDMYKIQKVLSSGGVIIYPTDTVYGLGVDIFNEIAIKNLFKLKGRNFNKAISVLFSDIENISHYAYLDEKKIEILNNYLPGPFTFILEKKVSVSKLLAGNTNKLGIRIPNNKTAIEIAKIMPITTTSANISSKEVKSNPLEIANELNGKIDLIIDGGILTSNNSSTVVDLTHKPVKILRQGIGNFEL